MLDPGFFPYMSCLVFGLFLFLYIYKSFWARILKSLLGSVHGLGWAAVDCFSYGFSWCSLLLPFSNKKQKRKEGQTRGLRR